jgi:hypothetical protein
MHASIVNSQNKKSKLLKQQSGHSRPNTMVWKIRRNSRGHALDSHAMREYHAKLKSCLKNECSSQNSSLASSNKNCEQSTTIREQSTGSGRSLGSRSGHSRGSGSLPSEQHSFASGSSASSGAVSRNSSARASQRGERSERAQQEKAVRFSEIHIRDYERVVGDNPSCSTGPPIG